jgi:polyisoprenyl-phosphate glycosyltransferase
MSKAVISVITPCYNEEGNAELIYERVQQIFTEHLDHYDYEHIFIDNDS